VTALGTVETVLLLIAVVSELLCCLGLVAFDDVFDRLHLMSAAGTLGPAALALAVVIHGPSSARPTAVVIVALLWVSSPVVTHAIASVAHERSSKEPMRS